jgi:hypothetical protein
MASTMRRVWHMVALLGLATSPVAGQRPITVTGVRTLNFGTLLPGVPRTVARTDPVNSGQFTLGGPHGTQAQLTFTLPSVMTGPAGATLPLVFGGGAAGYSQTQNIGSQVGFDPTQPFVVTFSQQGSGSVYLGGSASPASTQRAGTYSATITLNVATYP